jgi:Xaa-Pro aminopeptidase
MRVSSSLLLILFAGCASSQAAPARTAVPVTSSWPAVSRWDPPPLPQPAPVSAAELAGRRQRLLQAVGDGVLIVFGSPAPALDYLPYEQDPDFRYLTGIVEPGAAYVAVRSGDRTEELLFVQPRDPARELWEGTRLGPAGAGERTGIRAQPNDRFLTVVDSLLRVHNVLHTTTVPPLDAGLGANLTYAQQTVARLRDLHSLQVRSAQGAIRQLRAVKSPAELDRIRRAVYISVLAHREAMRALAAGMNEFEIRALLEYMFLRNGAEGPAYSSIVGSGPNATILHYRAADRFMSAGEILLIDAAASYAGYAADVTRSLPVNGTYTPEQRAIYDVVLRAQKAAESRIRPGATWPELRAAANHELQQGLAALGLIDAPDASYDCGRADAPAQCMQYRIFYMHGLGHGVGLAVHDPDVSESAAGFGPGSAVTIEPGIYVRADAFDHLPDTPANRAMIERLRPALQRYLNIGVRIEDVYIFDERGVERASRGVPREIDEIEALMREPSFAEPGRRADFVEWYRLNRGR